MATELPPFPDPPTPFPSADPQPSPTRAEIIEQQLGQLNQQKTTVIAGIEQAQIQLVAIDAAIDALTKALAFDNP